MAVGKRSLVHGPVLEEDRGEMGGSNESGVLGFVLFFMSHHYSIWMLLV